MNFNRLGKIGRVSCAFRGASSPNQFPPRLGRRRAARRVAVWILLVGFSLIWGVAEDFPRDVSEMISKLERFESEEWEKAKTRIVEKRKEVAKVLETALERETKRGNLEVAVALKKKIEELNGTMESSGKGPRAKNAGSGGLGAWLETVEFHDASGRWIITPTEVIQHSNKGGTKRFKRIQDDPSTVSFEASETLFRFEIDDSKAKGFRKSEKFAPIPFTVEMRKQD